MEYLFNTQKLLKKIGYFLLMALYLNVGFINSLSAQNTAESELYVGYGVGTLQEIHFGVNQITEHIVNAIFEDVFGDNYTAFEKTTTETGGVIAIGYNRHFSNRWSLGLIANYQGFKSTYDYSDGNTIVIKQDYWTAMVRTDFRWLHRPNFQAYSSIMGGGTYIHRYAALPKNANNQRHDSMWAVQANLLGMRFGSNKGLGGFIELGFGSNGILHAGLSYKF